jgi:hypothetical protein
MLKFATLKVANQASKCPKNTRTIDRNDTSTHRMELNQIRLREAMAQKWSK